MGRDEKLNPFARHTAIPQGPPTVHDVYGRELVEQDLIQLHPIIPPLFRVTSIRPLVDPTQPANLMEIELACVVRFRAGRGSPNQEFIKVISAAEALQKGARPAQAPAPPPPQPAGRVEGTAPLLPVDGKEEEAEG